MDAQPSLRFDNTQIAFSYKSDNQLRKASFIFNVVNHPAIARLATWGVKWGLKLGLPIKGIIRATAFQHFCGGETIEKCEGTIQQLDRFQVKTILDYSVEGAKTEAGFDAATEEVLRTVDKAKGNSAIPFCVFKVTGIADAGLLEKVQQNEGLTLEEQQAFSRIRKRVDKICNKAYDYQVPVLIDAEDSWYQRVIDDMAYEMMKKYNVKSPIVFNTFQMYRADMYDNLVKASAMAKSEGYFLGVKMVRGAYMEIERKRAEEKGYADPIQPTKEASDESFNKGLNFCIENIQHTSLMCGSHNEHSNLLLTELMSKNNLSKQDKRVWFAQLLGMSDTISFNLAKAGYNVAKYVPYGPVEAVMPYLFRRAEENTSVEGQSSRELILIRKELKRRSAAR
ncbi:MAG TPA: proline dehydrogenase family protein [Cyclobacteriaceae bacterium]|nr:proline dehydrogenase family protein [Cyclobacteriaceae bacterium]